MSGTLYILGMLLPERTPVPIELEAAWASSQSGHFEKQKKSGFEPQIVQPTVYSL